MHRSSSTSSTLNGLFKEVYAKKISDLVPGPSLFDINKATYSLWNSPKNYFETPYSLVVHPDTYKKLMEDTTMATCDMEAKCTEETPLQRELNHRKYQVRELRASIARKQEELRIALALLAAVKKLDKGGK